ncbi:hypothetical protein FQA39_LY13302 [Lamprigera yunnana]|nr:hypothetical protein FQA39_LY13302 [Lamprigera yunnana]
MNDDSYVCNKPCEPGCSCQPGYIWNNQENQCILSCDCEKANCGPNEKWSECAKLECRETCQRNKTRNCGECQSGCICKKGYIWDENIRQCVLRSECTPECRENQEWNKCGSPCKKNCSNYNDTTACTLPCHSGCFCKEGYVWNKHETECKPVTSCPNRNLKCEHNQVWESCSDNACKTTCGNRDVHKSCPTCIEGCSCKPGFVWNDELTGCVPERECPHECEHNQVWESCSDNACKKTCENKDVSVACLDVCIAGCSCRNGSVWTKDLTKCMPVEECPKACGEHQVWQGCSDYLCRRTCDSLNVTISCPTVCIPGCSCEEGYVWNKEFTKCIPKDSCPHQCDQHQVWEECSDVNCKRTCANMNDDSYVCNKPCEPGCSCQPGYIWNNQENQCILSCDCEKANCGPNEKWSECAKLECRETCQRNKTRNCGECQSGCICKKGYIWDENIRQCVLRSECTPDCGINEEWSSCTNPCERTCQGPSPGACIAACVPGCACKSGCLHDLYQRKCVLISECSQACEHPKLWCKHTEPHQVTCQNLLYPRCVSSDYFQQIFYPGCICPIGFILDQTTNKCVTVDECFNTESTTPNHYLHTTHGLPQ